MKRNRSHVMLKISCLIGIFLGGIALWMLTKDSIFKNFKEPLPVFTTDINISGIIFSSALVIAALFTLMLWRLPRRVYLFLLIVNFLIASFYYFAMFIRLPVPREFWYHIMPLHCFFIGTYGLFFKLFPDSMLLFSFWLEFCLAIGLPSIAIIFLTRPKVKELFK